MWKILEMRSTILKSSASLLRRPATISFSQYRWLRSKEISVLEQHNCLRIIFQPNSKQSGRKDCAQFCLNRDQRHFSSSHGLFRHYDLITYFPPTVGLDHLTCLCKQRSHTFFIRSRLMSQKAISEINGNGLERSSKDNEFVPVQLEGVTESHSLDGEIQTTLDVVPEVRIEDKTLPELSRTVYNLAPYVQRSETLQKLVKIGVNLSKVERVKGMASLLVMSDFDVDILPYLRHLIRVGVQPDRLGYVITVNPLLLTEYVEDLEQRVGYLLSKDFTMAEVASMFTRAPVMIQMDPLKLDTKLGFLQKAFDLSGPEVRQVALIFPKILPWRKEKIANVRFNLMEFLGFGHKELKLMLLREPKLFTADIHRVKKTFDYIHNTMAIPHKMIVRWPAVLSSRLHVIKVRHLFLLHLGRAQYDPYKENYISMKSLVACKDDKFCEEIAKSTLDEFYSFQKTL